jgi:hypothetical protein
VEQAINLGAWKFPYTMSHTFEVHGIIHYTLIFVFAIVTLTLWMHGNLPAYNLLASLEQLFDNCFELLEAKTSTIRAHLKLTKHTIKKPGSDRILQSLKHFAFTKQ